MWNVNERIDYPVNFFLYVYPKKYMSNAQKRRGTGDDKGVGNRLDDGDGSTKGGARMAERERESISGIANYAVARGPCQLHDSELG